MNMQSSHTVFHIAHNIFALKTKRFLYNIVNTYNIIFVFPLHLREIHAAVVGLPPLLTLLILHTGTQYI